MLKLDVPPGAAFDYLADPRHRPEWQASLRSVELADDGPPRVGMRWVDRTVVGVRPRLVIVELTPPDDANGHGAWSETGEWRGLRARLRLTFAPAGQAQPGQTVARGRPGTRLGVELHLDSTPLWLPVRLLLHALAPRAVKADLRRAARILQHRSWRTS